MPSQYSQHPGRLDLSSLKNVVLSLEDALAVVQDAAWFSLQSDKVQNTLLAGVVQNFEFVYELSIKMLKRQIELELASPNEVDQSSFRDLLRLAGEKALLADVEAWFKYRQLRNITAHTYDHQKARLIYENTLVFINDAKEVLQRLEARNA